MILLKTARLQTATANNTWIRIALIGLLVLIAFVIVAAYRQSNTVNSNPSKVAEKSDVRGRWENYVLNDCQIFSGENSNYVVKKLSPGLGPILNEYYELTCGKAKRAGAMHLAFEDEDGKALSGVVVSVRYASSRLFSFGPGLNSKTYRDCSVVDIPWGSGVLGMEIECRKPGYRTSRAFLEDLSTGAIRDQYDNANKNLIAGVLIPVASVDANYALILRREVKWSPPPVPESDDGFLAAAPDVRLWPKEIAQDAISLCTSDRLGLIKAQDTGVYALTDCNRKVLKLFRVLKGDLFGFGRFRLAESTVDKTVERFEFVAPNAALSVHCNEKAGPYYVFIYKKAE